MNKDIKRILLVLGLYSAAGGLLYSFQELWMQSNNLSISTIGNVYSLCAILSVSVIFLCSNIINKHRLKKLELGLILTKIISVILLFLLNGTNLHILIKFLIMVDYVVDVEIYACIYPMLSLIEKDDKLYARRGLIYSACYNIAVLFAGLSLGKVLINFKVNYNVFILMAGILMIISFIVLKKTNLNKYITEKKDKNNNTLLLRLMKILKEDKISLLYLLELTLGQVSYYSVMGIIVSILTNYFNFAASTISLFQIITGIAAVGVGTIILEKLTFKNDYINIGIKFGGRFLLYLIAFLINNKIIFLITFLYVLLLSESYSHVSDAPFINRFDDEYQLAFCNLREMAGYFGRAIGTFICGVCFVINIRFNFLIAGIFSLGQIIFLCLAINYKRREKNDR